MKLGKPAILAFDNPISMSCDKMICMEKLPGIDRPVKKRTYIDVT